MMPRVALLVVLGVLVVACGADPPAVSGPATTTTIVPTTTTVAPTTIPVPSSTTTPSAASTAEGESPGAEGIGVTERITIIVTDPDDGDG